MFRPDILAYGHADFFAVNLEGLDATGWLEITIFIENILGRQKRLVRFAQRFSALEQGRGIMKWLAASFVAIHKTDEQRWFSDERVKFFQDRKILRNKTRFKNQVLRRISGDGQFRRQNQFRAHSCKTLVRAYDQFAVASQIPYRRVNLSKANLHAALRQIKRNVASSNPLLQDSMGSFLKPFVCRLGRHRPHPPCRQWTIKRLSVIDPPREARTSRPQLRTMSGWRRGVAVAKNRLPGGMTFW